MFIFSFIDDDVIRYFLVNPFRFRVNENSLGGPRSGTEKFVFHF